MRLQRSVWGQRRNAPVFLFVIRFQSSTIFPGVFFQSSSCPHEWSKVTLILSSSCSFNWCRIYSIARPTILNILSKHCREETSSSCIPETFPSNKHFIFIMCTWINPRRPCCLGDYRTGQSGADLLKVTGLPGVLNSSFICFWQGEQVAECELPCAPAKSIKKVQANTSNKQIPKSQIKAPVLKQIAIYIYINIMN